MSERDKNQGVGGNKEGRTTTSAKRPAKKAVARKSTSGSSVEAKKTASTASATTKKRAVRKTSLNTKKTVSKKSNHSKEKVIEHQVNSGGTHFKKENITLTVREKLASDLEREKQKRMPKKKFVPASDGILALEIRNQRSRK